MSKRKLSAWESNPARARVVLIVDIMTSANVTNTPAKMLCCAHVLTVLVLIAKPATDSSKRPHLVIVSSTSNTWTVLISRAFALLTAGRHLPSDRSYDHCGRVTINESPQNSYTSHIRPIPFRLASTKKFVRLDMHETHVKLRNKGKAERGGGFYRIT